VDRRAVTTGHSAAARSPARITHPTDSHFADCPSISHYKPAYRLVLERPLNSAKKDFFRISARIPAFFPFLFL
jgi:hypothetical protein